MLIGWERWSCPSRSIRSWRREEPTEVVGDDVGAVLGEQFALPAPVHTHDKAESAGPSGLYAGDGVLEDGRPRGCSVEQLGGLQERVRRRLPGEVEGGRLDAGDPSVEEAEQPGTAQDHVAVLARGHHSDLAAS